MKNFIISIVLVATMFGQAPAVKPQKQAVPAKPSIDTVIELVQGGMSESLVIKTLRTQGRIYTLSPEDLVKLQKAGVTENIISVMMDPKAPVLPPAIEAPTVPAPGPPAVLEMAGANGPSAGGAAPAPASAASPTAGVVTPFPPDLEAVPTRKHRIIIGPLDYSAAKQQVQYYFNRNEDIGDGIRSMLESQVSKLANVVVLERRNMDAVLREQDFSNTKRAAQKGKPVIGRVTGADYFLIGQVVAFGVGTTTKKNDFGDWLYKKTPWGQRIPNNVQTFNGLSKEDKALVSINYRLVDAETLEMSAADSAQGQSVHKTKDLKVGSWGQGSVQNFGSSTMTSPDFQQTIIGEATNDAVNKIAKQLEEKIAQIPPRPRNIVGRVASATTNGVYLALGESDGVLRGDRFEILRINNEVFDPQTKDSIDVETEKIGELVVTEVHDHAAIGNYGGQQLLAAQLSGKGYQARLISK